MRQAPNGVIHLISTMNRPCLHFAFNEAWLEADGEQRPASIMANTATAVDETQRFSEGLGDGTTVEDEGGVANDGRFVLHGEERWRDAEGTVLRAARWEFGRNIGKEWLADAAGRRQWEVVHEADRRTRVVYLPGGRVARSRWRGLVADGEAIVTDADGQAISRWRFSGGTGARAD
jgi:hypothetical protein